MNELQPASYMNHVKGAINASLIVGMCMTSSAAAPHEGLDLSCNGFSQDIFESPTDAISRDEPGVILDGSKISNEGMTPEEGSTRDDGSPFLTKDLGTIIFKNGRLSGDLAKAPANYNLALERILHKDPEVLFGVCQLTEGFAAAAINDKDDENAYYNVPHDGVELGIYAGAGSDDFDNEQGLHRLAIHELGHRMRAYVLNEGTDKFAIDTIKQLDDLYSQQLIMAAEDIRVDRFAEVDELLAAAYTQIEQADAKNINNDTKLAVRKAALYLEQRLQAPNGLSDFIVSTDTFDNSPASVGPSISSMQEMIAKAYTKATGEKSAPFNLDKLLEGNKDGQDTLSNINLQISLMFEPYFFSEHVLPGDNAGEAWVRADESFASIMLGTKEDSVNHNDVLVAGLAPKYKDITLRQIQLIRDFRNHLAPKLAGHRF